MAQFVVGGPFQIAGESQRQALQTASDLRFAIRIANRNHTKLRDLEHLRGKVVQQVSPARIDHCYRRTKTAHLGVSKLVERF